MRLRAFGYLVGALVAGAAVLSVQATSLPEPGHAARHLTGKTTPAELREGWYDEEAIYLVRLDKPALVFRDRAPVLKDEGGNEPTADRSNDGGRPDLASQASQTYLSELAQQRQSVLEDVSAHVGRSVTPTYVYRYANNGFAVELTPAEAETVARLPGVRDVHRDYELELHTDAGPEWIGAPAIWDSTAVPPNATAADSQGEGVVFGIIDTGIAPDNPSFAETTSDGFTPTNPLGPGNFLGDCADGGSHEGDCNAKLIGMRSYDSLGNDPIDSNGHGSHVAGTAAGNPVTLDVGGETVTIQGVAPRGNIIAYNACCTGSALAAAMEDVVADYNELNTGGDVPMAVNYSIGAPIQLDPWERFDGQGFLAMREVGIFVATSAGNSGSGEATVGTPGVAPWVATAANSTHDRQFGTTTVSVTGPGTPPAELEDMTAEPGDGPDPEPFSDKATVFAGSVDADNDLACEAFSDDTAFSNGVAVIRRGDCTFEEKLGNAADAGADFVLMVNNEPGAPITMGFENPPSIPSAMVSQNDGENVIDWLTDNDGGTMSLVTGAVTHDPELADQLNFSSSRGPIRSVPSVIGPDLAAPGTDILAPVASSGGEPRWGLLTGTSMASPHVAGSAGLLFGVHETWTAGEIQSALMMTAERDLTDFDGDAANILEIGAGRVDLNRAAEAGFVLDETAVAFDAANPADGGDPATLNLPAFSTGECDSSCTFTRTLTGKAATTVNYNITAQVPDGVTVETAIDGSPSSTLGIQAGETRTLEVTVSGLHSTTGRFGSIEFESQDMSRPSQHMPLLLDNVFGEISGFINEIAPNRLGEMRLIREDESGGEEVADSVAFLGDGGFRFFFFSMVPEVNHPRLEILVDGYEDLIIDNNGQGFEPVHGETFDQGVLSLTRLSFEVSSTGVDERKRTSVVTGFEVETYNWPFQYEVTKRLADGDTEEVIDSDVVDAPEATETFEQELEDLVCGTGYVMTVKVRHLTNNAEYQPHEFDLTTRDCMDGSGDGVFSCTIGSGDGRWDPVVPLLLSLVLFGLATRARARR